MADILINLANLATEMGKLVSEGNDEAMAKLTTDQLAEPGAPESEKTLVPKMRRGT